MWCPSPPRCLGASSVGVIPLSCWGPGRGTWRVQSCACLQNCSSLQLTCSQPFGPCSCFGLSFIRLCKPQGQEPDPPRPPLDTEIQGGEATEDLPVEAGRGCLEPNPPQPLCLDGAEAQSWHEHPGGSPELLAKDVGAPAVPGESPPAELPPALGPLTSEECGATGMSPEAVEMLLRAGAPLLWRQAGTSGAVQPGDKKVLRTGSPFHCLKGLQKNWRGTMAWEDKTRGSGFKLTEGRVIWYSTKKFFPVRGVRPAQVVQSSCSCPIPGSVPRPGLM
ncbi:uncharacterized protein LOC120513383 isoform X3 [Passer montanus]|uniref:uncharacterized protein LOC120513383 isoform X3 n=1 Tax=Passer montanus TaxID=9160 RepID=UPI001961944E|nr:uncharacterized protein LOC120513383 isoform X3 [Passer montanus]XP_039588718.1 uncharacterized protein LOC120513383 isoform X3 [Passer montanus]